MNLLAFFNREKNSSADVAKQRLKVAIGKATLDIDSLISDLQAAINHSLAKYAIESDVNFKHRNNKLEVEIPVEG